MSLSDIMSDLLVDLMEISALCNIFCDYALATNDDIKIKENNNGYAWIAIRERIENVVIGLEQRIEREVDKN